MNIRQIPRLVLIALLCMVLFAAGTAVAAANTVPLTRLDLQTSLIDANAIKPPECAALDLTAVVICPQTGGSCAATSASALVIGSPFADTIAGGKGNDCMLGGGGDDHFKGGQGSDVCIGGPGNDTFQSCATQIQ